MFNLWTTVIILNGSILSFGTFPSLIDCANHGFKVVHSEEYINPNTTYYCLNEGLYARTGRPLSVDAKKYMENATKENIKYNTPEKIKVRQQYIKDNEEKGDALTAILGILGAFGG